MPSNSTPKQATVDRIVGGRSASMQPVATAFAPINIALIKYWGKRDEELNLPVTSSLSLALAPLGTTTEIQVIDAGADRVILNGQEMTPDSEFFQRLTRYLDLFRAPAATRFLVRTINNVPTASGLASSASGFAALALALARLFSWELSVRELSILARLGSGSACRSLHAGFVEWQAGNLASGMDSHAVALPYAWPELRVGVLTVDRGPKPRSSRAAMKQTMATSRLYRAWPAQVERDLTALKQALEAHDFPCFGATLEGNAMAMHATALAAQPPLCFWQPRTLEIVQKLWRLRADGLQAFVTLDAGPHPVVFFLAADASAVTTHFPEMTVIAPRF